MLALPGHPTLGAVSLTAPGQPFPLLSLPGRWRAPRPGGLEAEVGARRHGYASLWERSLYFCPPGFFICLVGGGPMATLASLGPRMNRGAVDMEGTVAAVGVEASE